VGVTPNYGSGMQPGDVRLAASSSRETLDPLAEADWGASASGLEWDCRTTLEHSIHALDRYSLYLASLSPRRLPFGLVHYPDCSNRTLLLILGARAAVLAEVVAAASPASRGYHAWGRPDPPGYLAMGCAEILVHTGDIAGGLGSSYRPAHDLCRRVLARLFPWAPKEVDPWDALRWATGRMTLPGYGSVGPNWAWHASPVAEWDGTVKTQESYPPR
jgi:hypothetical protein